MSNFFDVLNEELISFIEDQHMFFVSSACSDGRINLSPKGIEGLKVINSQCVAYLDFTGSGNETAAHIKGDGRLTIMLCSFGEKPLILRMYGRGRIISQSSSDWAIFKESFNDNSWLRQFVVLDIESVQTSCGFGVPHYEYTSTRSDFDDIASNIGNGMPEFIANYQKEKNKKSIDGFPTGIELSEKD